MTIQGNYTIKEIDGLIKEIRSLRFSLLTENQEQKVFLKERKNTLLSCLAEIQNIFITYRQNLWIRKVIEDDNTIKLNEINEVNGLIKEINDFILSLLTNNQIRGFSLKEIKDTLLSSLKKINHIFVTYLRDLLLDKLFIGKITEQDEYFKVYKSDNKEELQQLLQKINSFISQNIEDRVYTKSEDLTLTSDQSTEGFSTESNFRASSNATVDGYKSGYHECFLPTDMYNSIKKHLNSDIPYDEYFKKETNITTAKIMCAIADGFRTDTAQTIMCREDGLVAGHSGSGVSLIGQANAHNTLRKVYMKVLKDNKSQGITTKSIATLGGAITVTSIAPWKYAREIYKGTQSLKAGVSILRKWENLRNEVKCRVRTVYEQLTQPEKDFVATYIQKYLKSVQDKVNSRKIKKDECVSEERSADTKFSKKVNGTEYLTTRQLFTPELDPPSNEKELPYYFTQPLRNTRRTL